MDGDCFNLQVTFADTSPKSGLLWALFLGSLAFAGSLLFVKKRRAEPVPAAPAEIPGMPFGNSRLDMPNLMLWCNGVRHELTYREAKLIQEYEDYLKSKLTAQEYEAYRKRLPPGRPTPPAKP